MQDWKDRYPDSKCAEERLAEVTSEFEKTFESVLDFERTFEKSGNTPSRFRHDGKWYEYVIVSGSGPVEDDDYRLPDYDNAEQAINALRKALRLYEGKRYLYWRTRPEIEQNPNSLDIDGKPNPSFGKWKVYSRFRVID